jgi:predicted O-methyltransferase YrrM
MIRDVPWITDGANDFLREMISAKEIKSILEFGSGASTYWFAKQDLSVISVEHDVRFYNFLSPKLKDYPKITYVNAPLPYEKFFLKFCDGDSRFDLVFVDGRRRVSCVAAAHHLVKSGGYLMLDNDERAKYAKVHTILGKWDKKIFEQKGPTRYASGPHPTYHYNTPEKRWITTVWRKPA